MKVRRLIAPVLAALAMTGVLAASGVAGSGSTEGDGRPTAAERREMREEFRQRHNEHLAAIAKRLDVPTEQLKAALPTPADFFSHIAEELGKESADVRRAFEAERPERGRHRSGDRVFVPHPGGPHHGAPGSEVMPAPTSAP